VCILASLALVIVELGRVVAEVAQRRTRSLTALEAATERAQNALRIGNARAASDALQPMGHSAQMRTAIGRLALNSHRADWDDWSAKLLADFDYDSTRRLERTRILVRAGPALGLMGTLIPLAPGLAALAKGDTVKLSDDLRIAFSVTILGLLVGALAFAVSLIRDRLYAQDLSDLEFIVAAISRPPSQPAVEQREQRDQREVVSVVTEDP
jgi:biopolymer transport protein ExbB/TolQ